MNRRQRRAHALVWPLLAAALTSVFAAALFAKAHVTHEAARAAGQAPR